MYQSNNADYSFTFIEFNWIQIPYIMHPKEQLMKLLIFTLGLASLSVLGQTTATVNTSSTDVTPSILEKIKPDRISHFSIVAGPSIDGNADPRNSDGTIDTDGPNSWHQVSFQYQLDKRTHFVVNPRFTINRSEQVGNDQAVGKLDNPVLGIQRTWYKNGNFTFAGGLNTMFAQATESARERGTEWNPGGFNAANYKVNDKLNVGSWIWGRYEYHRNDPDRRRAPYFAAPYLSYSLKDKLTFRAFYQMYGQVDNANTLNWDDDGNDMNLSLIYNINKQITIQPIITTYQGSGYRLDQGNFNMWISGRFL